MTVLSESDSAPPCLKNGSGEDADPPNSRRAAIDGRPIVPHGPSFSREAAFLLSAVAALPREPAPGGAASLPWQTMTRQLFSGTRGQGSFSFTFSEAKHLNVARPFFLIRDH